VQMLLAAIFGVYRVYGATGRRVHATGRRSAKLEDAHRQHASAGRKSNMQKACVCRKKACVHKKLFACETRKHRACARVWRKRMLCACFCTVCISVQCIYTVAHIRFCVLRMLPELCVCLFWHEFGIASRKAKKISGSIAQEKEKDIYTKEIYIYEKIYIQEYRYRKRRYIYRERYIYKVYIQAFGYIFENANMRICEKTRNSFNKTLKKL